MIAKRIIATLIVAALALNTSFGASRLIVTDSGGDERTVKRLFVIDSGGTARLVKRLFVIDSGGTARLVCCGLLDTTITVDTDGAFFGYDNFSGAPFGSIGSPVLSNSQIIAGITWTISATGAVFLRLQGTSITNDDTTFSSIEVGGLAGLARSSASYTANDGNGNTLWTWTADTTTLTGPTETLVVR